MTIDTESRRHLNVPCPFCNLLCDDLVIENRKGKLKVSQHGCHLAKKQFEQEQPGVTPRIGKKDCTLEDATRAAAKILKRSKQALIGGLGTDVNGARAALQLTEKASAIIDHMHSDAAFRNLDVMQNHGWVMTTMAEIKNRADLIIFAGTDANTNYPRFFERVIYPNDSLVNANKKNRQIVYIGENLNIAPAKKAGGKQPINLECRQDKIGEVTSTIHAIAAGQEIVKHAIGSITLAQLKELTELIQQAKYGVIVWAPGELNFPYAELTVQSISELVKYLNRTTRFSGFTLGGNEGGMTANQVTAWQSGYPSRVSFAKGYPEYDPYRFSAWQLLRNKEIDALLWISSFSAPIEIARPRIPTIVLAAPSIRINFTPDIFIPVSTPGINHVGQIIRTDSVVSLKLRKIQESQHPSVSEVLNQITNQYR